MELLDHNTSGLKKLWNTPTERQNAKIVILEAMKGTEITVKVAEEVLDEIDRLLEDKEEEIIYRKDPAT
jgi:hypothetical protein